MVITGLQKLTLLDYPKKMACIIFTAGCNYKCSFCQNSDLIPVSNESYIDQKTIFEDLEKRKNVLDGVVISGGEPTIQKNLKNFIKRVKEYKLLVKLDTNGSNPSLLKELIDEHLIDYVAMDIKNTFGLYEEITGVTHINIDKIKESIEILKQSNIDYEFRTTIMKNYHDLNKIKEICNYLGPKEKYYLQNFRDSDGVLDKSLIPFSDEELRSIKEELIKEFPNVKVRGI